MNKQELFKTMNEMCKKAKIKDQDIETILKIRKIKIENQNKAKKIV